MDKDENELLLENGRILTLDPACHDTDAMLVRSGRVDCVGSREEAISRCYCKPEVIDLEGRTVVPGFVESHMHPSILATTLLDVDCAYPRAKSVAEIVGKIAERVKVTPKGEWVRGWGYDDSKLEERAHPTRWDLDRVSPDNPVYVRRTCAHMGVANSAALKISGVTADTPDPEGGRIDRDPATGEPTGLLMDRAQDLIAIPPYTDEEVERGFILALRKLSQWGITTVHDMLVDRAAFATYQRLAGSHRLPARVRVWLEGVTFGSRDAGLIPFALGLGLRSGYGNEMLKCMGMKFILDGSIGGRSAAVAEDYVGGKDDKGILYVERDELSPLVTECVKNGLRVSIHGIGERAIELAISSLEDAAGEVSIETVRTMRNRIDHCVLPTQDHLRRIKDLGLVVESSTSFMYALGDSWISNLGYERACRTFPIRTTIDMGIPMAGNSDSPVCDGSPLLGMYAAVTRKTSSGQSLGTSEGTTVDEALLSYTTVGAYAGCEEDLYGKLSPGSFADFVILSDNPRSVPPEHLKDIEVEMTFVGGTRVYSK
ncbi:MAG: amidohydrolase [Firmicutes bacterium]|nr:amidohydrolase [Bacillota bacterium]